MKILQNLLTTFCFVSPWTNLDFGLQKSPRIFEFEIIVKKRRFLKFFAVPIDQIFNYFTSFNFEIDKKKNGDLFSKFKIINCLVLNKHSKCIWLVKMTSDIVRIFHDLEVSLWVELNKNPYKNFNKKLFTKLWKESSSVYLSDIWYFTEKKL